MSKENLESVTELWMRVLAKCNEKNINITAESKTYFFVSYSSLLRNVKSTQKIKPIYVKKLAEFLEVSEIQILDWHENKDVTSLAEDSENAFESSTNVIEQTKSPFGAGKRTKVIIFSATCLLTLLCFSYYLLNYNTTLSSEKTRMYFGEGTDISLSMSKVGDDFQLPLYNYDFKNVEIKVEEDKLHITADIDTSRIEDPTITYIGKFEASGLYLDGNAAVTYKILINANNEAWIGVMMLKIETLESPKGYWLTILNDPDDETFGKFLFGDAYLHKH